MEIKIDFFKKGARNAQGLCVIIDVFRACTVLCHVANRFPKEIIISRDIFQIYMLKALNPDFLFIGKNHDVTNIIFNLSNSPTAIQEVDFHEKTVVHHSEGGISGLVESEQATEVITGSFVNAKAVVQYIQSKSVDLVTLICMGYLGETMSEEDEFCAEYIKALLLNQDFDINSITKKLRKSTGKLFFEGNENLPQSDFYYCLDYNKFNFILRKEVNNGRIYLKKLNI